MLLIVLALVALANAQSYNCAPYSAPNGSCAALKKSQKCEEYFQYAWDPYTSYPTVWPTRCVDNPTNRNCMASPLSPSTPSSGFCRPRCVTIQKRQFFQGTPCETLTTQSSCAISVSNCGTSQTTCDSCAWNNATSACQVAFICNNAPF